MSKTIKKQSISRRKSDKVAHEQNHSSRVESANDHNPHQPVLLELPSPATPEQHASPELTDDHLYRMSISLNVLNHLGIGLYSKVPAVLSEIVANAWDADADQVEIRIDRSNRTITVYDDGTGMSRSDINNKYLNVGYQKRLVEPGPTKGKNRIPMGRKGIGKLAVFSIADTVKIYSVKDGERCAFLMNAEKIKAQIEQDERGTYYPDPLEPDNIDFQQGTRIVLSDLKKNIANVEGYLRRRLARRFSIIGNERDFQVFIDDVEVTAKDREYYDSIEFLWYAGELNPGFHTIQPDGTIGLRDNVKKHFQVGDVVDKEMGYRVTGWIGTVDDQKSIDDENNAIVLFAHGKLIQEDVLNALREAGVYSKYIVGEIDADFMDADEDEDIVTSARQSVKEDDIRYQKLKNYITGVLKRIQNSWSGLRNEVGRDRALRRPGLRKWYEQQTGDNKRYAAKLFGKIESLKLPDPESKREMYKASLLAFETLALKNQLSILDSIETQDDLELVTNIFKGIDDLEAVHYYQIVKGRLEVVKEFERILDEDARERVIQRHIFDHLWLLHPSWERAAYDERIEQGVMKEWDKLDVGLTEQERKGRIDIRYRTAAGKHIIIELKKYRRKVAIYDLLEQIDKYRSALSKVIRATHPNDPEPIIESICILGSSPTPTDQEERNRALLRESQARYMTYDELISQTKKSYEEYMKREKKVSKLIATIESLDESFEIQDDR